MVKCRRKLAKARKVEMLALMRDDPEKALSLALKQETIQNLGTNFDAS